MKLIISAFLCEPPSNITCFRDITLYGSVFVFDDVLLSCKKGTRTAYWNWLKNHGAHDFISYLITDGEDESGYTIGRNKCNLNIDRINYNNFDHIIKCIKSLR